MRGYGITLIVVSLLALFVIVSTRAFGQEHHHPTGTITGATGQFYETWKRPDMPTASCCNQMDCYATRVRMRGGKVQALHRESGDWIDIPPEKIEQNRDSPDGRSHACMTPGKTVYCVVLGGGT